MKEGKSMEKAAEEYYAAKPRNERVRTVNVRTEVKQAFIAGWQEQGKEIERLKGLIKNLWNYKFLSTPIPDNTSPSIYEELHNRAWKQFKLENNL